MQVRSHVAPFATNGGRSGHLNDLEIQIYPCMMCTPSCCWPVLRIFFSIGNSLYFHVAMSPLSCLHACIQNDGRCYIGTHREYLLN